VVKLAKGLVVGCVTASTLLALAGTSAAEPNPPGCPKGYFCIYSGFDQTGTLLFKTASNWSGSVSGGLSVFNNGVRFPGADHVQLYYTYSGLPGTYSTCIHYNPGPGEYKINFLAGHAFKTVVWRGEC
jgi:hypothetical protein